MKKPKLGGSFTWWWRIPGYFVMQFFLWGVLMGFDWPVGRDVFGPYKYEPEWLVLAFWAQFLVVPWLPWRYRFFVILELVFAAAVATMPSWPKGGNVFAPVRIVPDQAWWFYWLQFLAVAIGLSRTNALMQRLKSRLRKHEHPR